MIDELRSAYNKNFSESRYQKMLNEISETYQHRPTFHICETPVFIPNDLRDHLLQASNDILDKITQPNFKELTEGSFFDEKLKVPNEDDRSKFVVMDFGVCHDERGELIPQLIELQGFSSLNFFQYLLAEQYQKHFDIPAGLSTHPGDLDRAGYLELMRREIVGDCDPKEVVLVDVEPEKQNTRIDFLVTAKELGIKELCVTKVIKAGRKLSYLEGGQEIPIKRIYNRAIFDELHQRTDLDYAPFYTEEIDAEWVGHPNWFYRISKYTLPLLKSKYVPDCYFLDQLNEYPTDLENFVLKPLYSFAGAGVKLHVTPQELDAISNRKNYILQKKVSYQPVVETLDVPAKCEIRVMAIFNSETGEYQIVNNLIRLSKGEMIGVKYNKDKTWVGGSIGYFEG